jgi:fatty acid synthase
MQYQIWSESLNEVGSHKLFTIMFLRAQDFDLAAFGNGVVVGRSANIFCHVGVYRGGDLVIEQGPSDFGYNSIVGTRAVTVTGFQLAPRSQLSTLELGLKLGEGLPV